MSLKYAVLAALLEGEASGYELSKVFDVSLANFWPATPQQLYRELERLAQDGLIEARVVQQERRPDKRLFTVTETGRRELTEFAAEPPRRPAALRDEFLIKIQAMDGVDPEAPPGRCSRSACPGRAGNSPATNASATGSSTAAPRRSTSRTRTRTGSARTSRSWEESPWRRRPSAGANGRLSS
jgi:DNA-binding PadR family transcriptional regulator